MTTLALEMNAAQYDAACWNTDPAALIALRRTGLSPEDALLAVLAVRREIAAAREALDDRMDAQAQAFGERL
jgi:hypothetical protein